MGYIHYSRSERSDQAISNYEVPLSMIKKDLITEFLDYEGFNPLERKHLERVPVSIWRAVAKHNGATSWHHTSKFYNKTNHYSLCTIAETLLETSLNDLRERFTIPSSTYIPDYSYGVVTAQIWGGTRKRPKVIGTETLAGIIKDDWIYCNDLGSVRRLKLSARKTISSHSFSTYRELVKAYPEYKGTVKEFNKLIKQVIK